MVDEPVDHRGGDDLVAEDLAPAIRLVAGDDERGALVAGRDELEEQVGGLGFERDLADLVDDQQRVAAQPGQLSLEASGVVGLGGADAALAAVGLAGGDLALQAGGQELLVQRRQVRPGDGPGRLLPRRDAGGKSLRDSKAGPDEQAS